jgi:hypothetical protein
MPLVGDIPRSTRESITRKRGAITVALKDVDDKIAEALQKTQRDTRRPVSARWLVGRGRRTRRAPS